MGVEGFGARLAQARRVHGVRIGRDYTQTELAEAMGVTPATVSRWESGGFRPDIEVVEKLAGILETDPGLLAFGISSTEEQGKNGNHHATPSNGVNHGRTVERPREAYEGPHRDETLRERIDRKKGKPRKQA